MYVIYVIYVIYIYVALCQIFESYIICLPVMEINFHGSYLIVSRLAVWISEVAILGAVVPEFRNHKLTIQNNNRA